MDTNNDVIKSTEFPSSNLKTYRTPKKWHFIASIIEIVLGFVCYALAFLAVLAVAVYIWNGGEVYSVLIVVLYSIYGILLTLSTIAVVLSYKSKRPAFADRKFKWLLISNIMFAPVVLWMAYFGISDLIFKLTH